MSEARTDPSAALRAALDAASRRAVAVETQNADLRARLHNETATRFVAQETAIDNAINAAEADASTFERQWSALQADGKFEEAGAALRKMSEATSRAERFKAQKQYLAEQRQSASANPPPAPAGGTSATQDWIARNPRFNTDQAFKNRALSAHHAAVADGVIVDTPEYFDRVERAVYPERYTQEKPNPEPPRAAAQVETPVQTESADTAADSPLSDTGEGEEVAVSVETRDRHTLPAAHNPVTIPTHEMRIDQNADGTPITEIKQEQQVRAVGKGGAGIASVAAPPSRNIDSALRRTTGGRQQVLSADEMETAIKLAEQIEPELLNRENPQIEVAKWYAALNAAPGSQRRLKRWYGTA